VIERVVFDTSTLIGAALKVGSKPHKALMLTIEFCVPCASEELIAELAEVLSRSYLDRRLTQSDRDRFLEMIRNNVEVYPVTKAAAAALDPRCRDADDNFILALALASQAEAIVSSDKDLLVLHPWNGIAILTPAQFLARAEI
jgi:putative PIN family toxin of toxin-antitoxin system